MLTVKLASFQEKLHFSFKYSFSHNLLILSAKMHISSKSPKCFCLKCSKSPKCLSFNRDEENFPRKKTRTNWICPDKFVRHDINRWLWEDYKAAGQTTGQIQFVRVIFLGHKHSFVMEQTMTYAPENGELEGRKLWVVFVNIKL